MVFVTWKDAILDKALKEMGEKFEAIEHAEIGKDGFEHANASIAEVELAFGLANLAQITAPLPPKT